MMFSFHGTSPTDAAHIAAGNVDVTLGGGELGRGFYTGEKLHVAKRWALHHGRQRQRNVVEFVLPLSQFFALTVHVLDGKAATLMRGHIRNRGATQKHLFHADVVWSEIVGKLSMNCDQYKWESSLAEASLNGATCARRVI